SFMIAPIIRFCADYEFDSVTPFHPASCVAPGSTFHSQAGGPSATALWHPLLPSPARDFAAELSCCGAWYYSLLSLVIDTYDDGRGEQNLDHGYPLPKLSRLAFFRPLALESADRRSPRAELVSSDCSFATRDPLPGAR